MIVLIINFSYETLRLTHSALLSEITFCFVLSNFIFFLSPFNPQLVFGRSVVTRVYFAPSRLVLPPALRFSPSIFIAFGFSALPIYLADFCRIL